MKIIKTNKIEIKNKFRNISLEILGDHLEKVSFVKQKNIASTNLTKKGESLKKILNEYYRQRHNEVHEPAFALGITLIITALLFLIGR